MSLSKSERSAIVSGKIIIFPTETFYGIGCRMDSNEALLRIVTLKGGRDLKPFPLIAANIEQILEWFDFPDAETEAAMREIWPAPLSIILPLKAEKRDKVSKSVHLNYESAVRISPFPLAVEIALCASQPIAATSANLSGEPPPSSPEEITDEVAKVAGCIIKGGKTTGQEPSTIIKVKNGVAEIVRAGAFPKDKLEKYFKIRNK